MILLIIVSFLALSYFHIELRDITMQSFGDLWNSATNQDNINFIWSSAQSLWNNYLRDSVTHMLQLTLNLIQQH